MKVSAIKFGCRESTQTVVRGRASFEGRGCMTADSLFSHLILFWAAGLGPDQNL